MAGSARRVALWGTSLDNLQVERILVSLSRTPLFALGECRPTEFGLPSSNLFPKHVKGESMPSTKHWSSLSVRCLVTLLGMVLFAAPTQAQQFAYVTNSSSSSVSVVDTATNTVTATVGVEDRPIGIAFTPDRSRVYVANSFSNSVSVIETATNTVIDTINIGRDSTAVAITPDGSRA